MKLKCVKREENGVFKHFEHYYIPTHRLHFGCIHTTNDFRTNCNISNFCVVSKCQERMTIFSNTLKVRNDLAHRKKTECGRIVNTRSPICNARRSPRAHNMDKYGPNNHYRRLRTPNNAILTVYAPFYDFRSWHDRTVPNMSIFWPTHRPKNINISIFLNEKPLNICRLTITQQFVNDPPPPVQVYSNFSQPHTHFTTSIGRFWYPNNSSVIIESSKNAEIRYYEWSWTWIWV